MVFGIGIFYAVVTTIELLPLKSLHDAIGNLYFTIMDILSISIALLITISIVTVHYYAPPIDKFFSLTSLIFMLVAKAVTSCVHFIIRSISHSAEAKQLPNYSFFFSFK